YDCFSAGVKWVPRRGYGEIDEFVIEQLRTAGIQLRNERARGDARIRTGICVACQISIACRVHGNRMRAAVADDKIRCIYKVCAAGIEFDGEGVYAWDLVWIIRGATVGAVVRHRKIE